MDIQFLGTGAADWDWSRFGDSEIRGSSGTLLGGHILIDAGDTGFGNLTRFGVDPGAVTDLLVTHSHRDHFMPGEVRRIAEAPRREPLRLWALPQALARIPDGLCDKRPLGKGDTFDLGALHFTVLPANHTVEDLGEECFHFLVEAGGKRLLYALDGGWLTALTRRMLTDKPLDMIVWDATSGNTCGDWRFAEHNDLAMIDRMRRGLEGLGLIGPGTTHVFNHIARTLWPESANERRQLAERFGGVLTFDGLELSL